MGNILNITRNKTLHAKPEYDKAAPLHEAENKR